MNLTEKYQEEIKVLKGKNPPKMGIDLKKSQTLGNKIDNGVLNILTTTDGSGSVFESSVTESSGYISNKDNTGGKTKSKASTNSQTPHNQSNKNHFNKTAEDKKSFGFFANKSDLIPKVKPN